MLAATFSEIISGTFAHLSNTLANKGSDYATDDVLSNFKRLSSAAKVLNIDIHTPIGYALFMCLMKLDRINNLITNSKRPKNESIADSFTDLIGYTLLALALHLENVDAS